MKKLNFFPFSAIFLVALVGCGGQADVQPNFMVTRSPSGLAEISSTTLRGAAEGVGYSYSNDNICMLQEQLMTVNGERSKYLGAEGRVGTETERNSVSNLTSDMFYRFYLGGDLPTRLWSTTDEDSRQLVAGYVDGINRYLKETPNEKIDEACRSQPWMRRLTLSDGYRLLMDKAILGSAANFIQAFVDAKPPINEGQIASAKINSTGPQQDGRVGALSGFPANPIASNGWAFGKDRTDGGKALLLGNPHFPWQSMNRFWQFRMTVPGKIDVAGAALGGFPVINIGYTKDIAWTHTVSTGRRFTLYELKLKSGDATRYIVDGKEYALEPVDISVEIYSPTGPQTRTQRFWRSSFGPLLELPRAGLTWNEQRAYAFADANLDNTRMLRSWLDLAQAKSVREARTALSRELGIPWANTIAADSNGEVMYADLSPIPNVDSEMLSRCAPSPSAAALMNAAFLPVLNGSSSDCKWKVDSSTPVPGLMPADQLASVIRTDYVANQNDSYWLANPAVQWPSMSPLLGPVLVEQRPRTRAQIAMFERRFAGLDGLPGQRMSAESMKTLWWKNDNYSASLVLDDLIRLCRNEPVVEIANGRSIDLRRTCDVLAAWDRTSRIQARGAHLFREFWRNASMISGVYAIPFDAKDPINTPRGLNISNVDIKQKLQVALVQAAESFESAGVQLDAELGTIQYEMLFGKKIAIPGGEEFEGVFNKQEFRGFENKRYAPYYGTSHVQVVTLGDQGARAEGLLVYSQSTDPASKWFGNQLSAYSDQKLLPLPFMLR